MDNEFNILNNLKKDFTFHMKFLIKTTGFINFDDYEAYILEGYIDCTNKSILWHIEYIKNHKSKTVLNIKIYQYLGTIFLQKIFWNIKGT